ncbi:SnoaL-like domain-containing protein [Durusdinium trenchii]|uniref:SnoaL-like domain-containing protein n=1 Tax=Durusdinium trenchii TaxID=1381693 RepID=A0ABP0LEE7_9DINO
MTEMELWVEKQKIYELCARYTLSLDGHDIQAWANCFTEDGVFGFGDHGLCGREKIAAYGQIHSQIASRHLNTSLLFEVDESGERATGQSTTVASFATREGFKVAFLGRYDDELQKVDGQWLFSRRWVVADTLPDDPAFDLLSADPDLVPVVQQLVDAYKRLGEPI